MNNKPVAWMAVNELNGSYSTFTNDQKQRLLPHVSQCYGKWIPLYTHPTELTDEEIIDIWFEVAETNSIAERQLAFARAILRKAQEK